MNVATLVLDCLRKGPGLGRRTKRSSRNTGFLATLILFWTAQATALQFDVTRTDDPVPDACQPADCSLREAVIAANAAAGEDVIVLQALTYALSQVGSGDLGDNLEVNDDLVVQGVSDGSGTPLTIIDVLPNYRHFLVGNAASLTLNDVQLTDGSPSAALGGAVSIDTGSLRLARVHMISNTASRGGAIYAHDADVWIVDSVFQFNTANNVTSAIGGALYSDGGDVDIRRSVFSQNTATSGGDMHAGGAISASFGNITIVGCTFEMNSAKNEGGAISFGVVDRAVIFSSDFLMNSTTDPVSAGGAIWSLHREELTIINSTFDQNNSGSEGGGALFVGSFGFMNQRTRIIGSQITGNMAGNGGGLKSFFSAIDIEDTLISGNQAIGDGMASLGGAVFATGSPPRSTQGMTDGLVIRRSLISGNNADGFGAGVAVESTTLLAENTTITANNASEDGGGINAVQSTVTLRHATLVDNLGTLASELRNPLSPLTIENSIINGSCQYLLMPTSNGGNVSGPDTSCSGPQGPNDQWGVSLAQLDLAAALADNGGPTETLALGSSSVAIDAGICGANCLTSDQRNYARNDGMPDSGAYEFGARQPSLLFADSLELLSL